jgi:hypothetical protein
MNAPPPPGAAWSAESDTLVLTCALMIAEGSISQNMCLYRPLRHIFHYLKRVTTSITYPGLVARSRRPLHGFALWTLFKNVPGTQTYYVCRLALFQLQCLLNPRHRALFDTTEAAAPPLGLVHSRALLAPDGTDPHGTALHTPAPMPAPDTRRLHARDSLSIPVAHTAPAPVGHPGFPDFHSLSTKGSNRASYASLTSPRAYAHPGLGGPHAMPPMTPRIATVAANGPVHTGKTCSTCRAMHSRRVSRPA